MFKLSEVGLKKIVSMSGSCISTLIHNKAFFKIAVRKLQREHL